MGPRRLGLIGQIPLECPEAMNIVPCHGKRTPLCGFDKRSRVNSHQNSRGGRQHNNHRTLQRFGAGRTDNLGWTWGIRCVDIRVSMSSKVSTRFFNSCICLSLSSRLCPAMAKLFSRNSSAASSMVFIAHSFLDILRRKKTHPLEGWALWDQEVCIFLVFDR